MSDEDILASLELEFSDTEMSVDNIVVVSEMKTLEIVDLLDSLNSTLFEMRQAINPTTQVARDMHSLRNACQVELTKRLANDS